MFEIDIENMNLNQIAESGQCFRWKKLKNDSYGIVAFGKYLTISQTGNHFTLSCDEKEWNEIWSDYFDMGTDYGKIKELIMQSEDAHLKKALEQGWGIRILKQDLWEMIVTFMISQNNNIKRITNSVEKICVSCDLLCENDNSQYRFPNPGEAPSELFDNKELGLGYRDGYLREIYAYGLENESWLEELKMADYDDAMKILQERKGIGKKVANCICLFGLHHVDAFPIDTHVKQLLEEHYSDGFDFERYKGVAGIVQQYLFYYELIKDRI